MDADNEIKLGGIGNDSFITDIIKINLLIIRVELNSLKAHFLYLPQLSFIILTVRMDASKGKNRPFLIMRSKCIYGFKLRRLCYNGQGN